MCLAAIYWSRLEAIFFGNTHAHAAEAGFDDSFLYQEVCRPIQQRSIPTIALLSDRARASFDAWLASPYRIHY